MRLLPVLIVGISFATSAQADPPGSGKPFKPDTGGKLLPLKGGGAVPGNSCAAYGTGFIKVEGTDSCVKIGGGVRVDVHGAR